ncbi:MAG: hypothetical protein AAF648_12740 [Pseudomonadota bacterium]
MRTTIILALGFSAAVLVAALFQPDTESSVFGQPIDESVFLAEPNPRAAFGRYVSEELTKQLTERLDLDLSNDAVLANLAADKSQPALADRLRANQRHAGKIADALDAVLKGVLSREKAYASHLENENLAVEQWRMIAESVTQAEADSYRELASIPVEDLVVEYIVQLRPGLLDQLVRASVCELSGLSARKKLGHFQSEIDRSFVCNQRKDAFIDELLDTHVRFSDPQLEGYRDYVSHFSFEPRLE